MVSIVNFVTVLAWIGLVLSGICWATTTYWNLTYPNSVQATIDEIQGRTRSWPNGKWLALMILSAAWLIAPLLG